MVRSRKSSILVAFVVLILAFAVVCGTVFNSPSPDVPQISVSGEESNELGTVSALPEEPLEDGLVPGDYQPAADATPIGDIETARSAPGGNYYLTGDINVTSIAHSGDDTTNAFSGVLDGCGHTITINAVSEANNANGNFGGLFPILSGTVKNCVIVVENFQAKLAGGSSWANAGMIAGAGSQNGKVENVRIILKHSPNNMANGSDNAYLSQYANQSNKGSEMRLGGVFGCIVGNVSVTDTTVDNQTTGNYGLSTKGWRAGGNFFSHSDGFAYIGGFFGRVQSGGITATRITLAGNSNAKIHAYNESTGSERYNRCFVGGILGYADNGAANINGLIVTYPMAGNLSYTNGNYDCASGIINGYADGGYGGSASNAYILDTALTSYSNSNGAGTNVNYNTFYSSTKLRFNGTEIAFGGFTKQAPSNASQIVATISQAGQTQNVMQALIATSPEEAGKDVWLSVPMANATSNTLINLKNSYASNSTVSMTSDLSFVEGESVYSATRPYNGANVTAPSIVLGDGRTDLVYEENGAHKNVGTHVLTSNLSAAGYSYIEYEGSKYVLNSANGMIYIPQPTASGNIFDITYSYQVEVTPVAITIGQESNAVTYGDSYDTVKANNVASLINGTALVGGESIAEWNLTGYTQFEVNAGGTVTLSFADAVIKDSQGGDVTANYTITYSESSVMVSKKLLQGTLSVENLIYDNTEKEAVFVAEEGMGLVNGDTLSYSYDGERINVTSEGFTVVATLPTFDGINSNYAFTDGNQISQTFVILPATVVIVEKEDRPVSHVYNGGVVSVDDLFEIPVGVQGEQLVLSLSATKDGQPATICNAGKYVATASLAEGQTNYTAEAVGIDYEITPFVATIGIGEGASSKIYDTVAVSQEELDDLFTAPVNAQGVPFELSVNSEQGEILNAGEYNVTATAVINEADAENYICEPLSVTYTVEKIKVNGKINVAENLVYDGNEKVYGFEFTGESPMLGQDEVFVTCATAQGQTAGTVKDAGTYTVTAVLPEYEQGKSNYEFEQGVTSQIEMTIARKDVTLTVSGSEKVYDAVAFDISELVVSGSEGFVESDKVAVEATVQDNSANVGEYPIVINVSSELENVLDNYNITKTEDAVFRITQRPVSVSWTNENNYLYNAGKQAPSYVAENLVGDDKVSESITGGSNNDSISAGEYTMTLSLPSDNYKWASDGIDKAVYTIDKLTVNVSVSASDKQVVYGSDYTLVASDFGTAAVNGSGFEAVLSVAYDSDAYTNGSAAGNIYNATLSVGVTKDGEPVDAANYQVTGLENPAVTVTVVKADPVVNVEVSGDFVVDKLLGTDIVISLAEGSTEGTVTWDNEGSALVLGNNDCAWTFTPSDTTNYNTATGVYKISAAKGKVTSVEVSGDFKKNYKVGETFNPEGMIVTVNYEGLESEQVTGYTVTPEVMKYGTTSVTVTYGGVSTVVEGIEVTKYEIAKPEIPTLTFEYNAKEQGIGVVSTEDYTVEGTTSAVNKGEYSVTLTLADPEKYMWTGESAETSSYTVEWNITAKKVNLTVEGATKTYDGAEFDFADYTVNGTDAFIADDNVTVTVYAEGASANAGTYNIVIATSADDNANYEITRTTDAKLVINKAVVEVPVSPEAVVYNGLVQKAAIAEDERYSVTGNEYKDAGEYQATLTLNDFANYEWAGQTESESVSVSWKINKADATITVNAASMIYKDNLPQFSAVVEGEVNGEKLVYTFSVTEVDNYVVGGDYTIEAVVDKENEVNKNYEIQTVSAKLTVNKLNVTVKANDAEKVYGTANPSFGYSFTQGKIYEDITVTFTCVAEDMSPVSEDGYAIIPKVEDFADMNNYDISYENGVLTVVKAVIEVNGQNASATYRGTLFTNDEVKNAIVGNLENVQIIVEQGEVEKAGVYNVTVKAIDENNYTLEGITEYTFTVEKQTVKEPEIRKDGYVYNKTLISLEKETSDLYSYKGTLESESAGVYEVTVTLKDSENYKWENSDEDTISFTWTIAKKDATVVVNNKTIDYGDELPKFDAEIDGVIDGDTLDIVVGIDYSQTVNAGEYAIKVSIDDESVVNKNYNIIVTEGILTVNKLKVENPQFAQQYDFVYDGTQKEVGLVSQDNFVVSGNSATNAGQYSLSVSLADDVNYEWADGSEGAKTLAWSIAAKKVNLTIDGVTKKFDGQPYDFGGYPVNGVDGFVASDNVVVTVSAVNASAAAGEYDIVITTSADDNANYEITRTTDAKLVIEKVKAQYTVTVGYEVLTIQTDGYDGMLEYKLGDGEWTKLPEDGKIGVQLQASYLVSVRYEGFEGYENEQTVAITADVVCEYLEKTYSGADFSTKALLDEVNKLAEKASGDKTQLTAKIAQVQAEYDAFIVSMTESVENALTVTGKLTSRSVAIAVSATAFAGLGVVAGAMILCRKRGKKDEEK